MKSILDWLLIIVGSFFTLKSYKKICFEKNCSVSLIIICVVYVFCVLPILFNYLIGVPQYASLYWYRVFIEPMNNTRVSIIYDIYILFSLIILFIYSNKYKTKSVSKSKIMFVNGTFFSKIMVVMPYIYILISGTFNNYLKYNTTTMRGFEMVNSSYFTILNAFIFMSLFTYYSNFFKSEKKTFFSYFWFILYNISIIWIVGKRYIIANILLTIIYYLSQSELSLSLRKKMYTLIPLIILLLVSFSGFYLIAVKPLRDTSTNNVYEMLRVDFGRDDVIKYTIEKDLIKNERILEFRGQSFLSSLLVLVPRRIWPSKPYPHYMYLTASLLNTTIFELPAGTTPSWYEMCISNFGYIGMIIACLGLLLLCKISDNSKNIDTKYIWLLFMIVLLTQGIEGYAIYIVLLIILYIISFLKRLKSDMNN